MTWTFKQPVRTPEEQAALDRLADSMDTAVLEQLAFINSHREHLVRAFMAETGLMPSECELVEQRQGDGSLTVYLRKRKPSEPAGL